MTGATVSAADPKGSDAPEITALVALAEVVGDSPGDVAELRLAMRARLKSAAAWQRACGRADALPLLIELIETVEHLGAAPGDNACVAVSRAMSLLAESLSPGESAGHGAEVAAITDLRSVRGLHPLWCCALLDLDGTDPGDVEAAPVADAQAPRPSAGRALSAYRKSLLRFLKADAPGAAAGLAGPCRSVAAVTADPGERRMWLAAAKLFSAEIEAAAARRPAMKRTAVRLEQMLKAASEGASPGAQALEATFDDLRVLGALIAGGKPDGAGGGAPAPRLRAHGGRLEAALHALTAGAADPSALAAIADAFLMDGARDRWIEALELARAPADAATLGEAAGRWLTPPAPAATDDADASTHFSDSRAMLEKMAAAIGAGEPPGAPAAFSGIAVDEALLDNLNLMAAEIRGARSRAEANLGNLRGGLMDMERTIKTLRAQLEALELDPGVTPAAADTAPSEEGVQARIGLLSRGIEELAGLKDTLESLTEDTESVLASQAGGDTRLEQDLLKTRLAPLGAHFDKLRACVARAAAGIGVSVRLDPQGGDVPLERDQAGLLAEALAALLEACVRKGMTGAVSPARSGPGAAAIGLTVSQAGFDVRADIAYHGAPLTGPDFAALKPALERAGAVCVRDRDDGGRARISLSVPGPPQSMDVLLVEVGSGRFGIPVDVVSGVSKPPPDAGGPERADATLRFDGVEYRLASLAHALRMDAPATDGGACVLIHANGGTPTAYRVDTVIGRERMLVRSPGPLLASNPWVFGAVVDELAAPTLVIDRDALEAPDPRA